MRHAASKTERNCIACCCLFLVHTVPPTDVLTLVDCLEFLIEICTAKTPGGQDVWCASNTKAAPTRPSHEDTCWACPVLEAGSSSRCHYEPCARTIVRIHLIGQYCARVPCITWHCCYEHCVWLSAALLSQTSPLRLIAVDFGPSSCHQRASQCSKDVHALHRACGPQTHRRRALRWPTTQQQPTSAVARTRFQGLRVGPTSLWRLAGPKTVTACASVDFKSIRNASTMSL